MKSWKKILVEQWLNSLLVLIGTAAGKVTGETLLNLLRFKIYNSDWYIGLNEEWRAIVDEVFNKKKGEIIKV